MKNIKEFITTIACNESFDARATYGAILEVELKDDGAFFWVDEKSYPNMKEWEIRKSKNGRGFVIKVGKLADLKK